MTNRIRALAAGVALLCPHFSVPQTRAIPERARLVVDFGFDYFGLEEIRYTNRLDTPADNLVRRVKEFWSVPSDLEFAKGHLVAAMTIDERGVVSDISIVQPSSIDAFDVAATNALALLNPTQLASADLPTRGEQVTVTFFINEASTPGRVPIPSEWPLPGVFRVGNDVTSPGLVTEVRPKFTLEHSRSRHQSQAGELRRCWHAAIRVFCGAIVSAVSFTSTSWRGDRV
jgi:hypothetical protein